MPIESNPIQTLINRYLDTVRRRTVISQDEVVNMLLDLKGAVQLADNIAEVEAYVHTPSLFDKEN